MKIEGRPLEVLLCEDSVGNVRLTREAFRAANKTVNLHVATDGVEALAFLRREGDYIFCPRPDLILLDLNMPKMVGREVLAILKADEDLKTIPVVVLTLPIRNLTLHRATSFPQIATSASLCS